MKFTEWKLYWLPLLAVCVSACQFMPATDTDTEQVAQESAAEGVARSPNPYLANRSSVPSEARKRFQAASVALAASDWSQAEQHLLWLTTHHAKFSGPWLNLALVYSELKQIDKAVAAFEQAIAANSQNVYAYNQYAIFLRGQGNFAEAEKQYQQALRVWPDYPEGHLNLAILYDLYMGQLTPALQHYQSYQALQQQPDRQVAGWIVDAERRLHSQQASRAGES